eukprot:CAMPEP_0204530446 /NCGR_PEP_ID=MMETSP0661-20131031/10628_1 /ASSEMBLY_ACC=CAM_ASM_000606 /TAXON_ID=109239 /ORGANISM="Alexandrium margalefi, Strain AMGDE01CS-322" /LENGTH=199 /DNA_ID=CAMNT_0051536541 /DNA_START=65 /DNA_END=664 /DNA_ORIENTATION=-
MAPVLLGALFAGHALCTVAVPAGLAVLGDEAALVQRRATPHDQAAPKELHTCGDIKSRDMCSHAQEKLNISYCAGWGGSSCLYVGADPKKITDPKICQDSFGLLGIESVGWGGAECLSADTAHCRHIKSSRICAKANATLGFDCAGWCGKSCLAWDRDERGGVDCRTLVTPSACKHIVPRDNSTCAWEANRHRCYHKED